MRIVKLEIEDDALLSGVDAVAFVETPAHEQDFYAFKTEKFESYTDYPESAVNAAKRALEYRDNNPDNDCGTPVGWARANQLAKREPISEETIARMASFARHLQYEDVPYSEGCGGLMVDAWGARAGIEWASRKLEEIREDFIGNSYTDGIASGLTDWLGEGPRYPNIQYAAEGNMDILGYQTQHFEICPGAIALFTHLLTMPITEENRGMIRSAAVLADQVFLLEKNVIAKELTTPAEMIQALALVEDFKDIIEQISLDSGMEHTTAFMDGHIEIIAQYLNEEEFKAALEFQQCPPATQDVVLNLKNRQHAIDVANYGPLNPAEPNTEYWKKKAEQFNSGDVEAAKKSICGNCAFFDIKQHTLDCIAKGIGGEDAYDSIDAGQLGYCTSFDFKCAAARTCDAWAGGGPVDDKEINYIDTLASEIQDAIIDALENVGENQSDYLDYVEMSQEEFHKHLFALVSTPQKESILDVGDTKIRYRYSGPRDNKNRNFCARLMSLTDQGKIFRKEDINQMTITTENQQFGTYDIFTYKGSYNCRHAWEALYFREAGNNGVPEGKRPAAIGDLLSSGVNKPVIASPTTGIQDKLEFARQALAKEQKVIGPLMRANRLILRVDEQGDPYYVYFTPKTIQRIADKFMREGRLKSFNLEHDSDKPVGDVYISEAWLVENPESDKSTLYGFKPNIGDWYAVTKIENKKFYKEYVETGRIKGYSVEGFFLDEMFKQATSKQNFVEPGLVESKDEFIGRCIPYMKNEGYADDQAAAICYTKWSDR